MIYIFDDDIPYRSALSYIKVVTSAFFFSLYSLSVHLWIGSQLPLLPLTHYLLFLLIQIDGPRGGTNVIDNSRL